jgi:hypothetical protein
MNGSFEFVGVRRICVNGLSLFGTRTLFLVYGEGRIHAWRLQSMTILTCRSMDLSTRVVQDRCACYLVYIFLDLAFFVTIAVRSTVFQGGAMSA